MAKKWIGIGSILVMLSVMIGAFGAHMLEPIIGEDKISVYETGVQYHMIHALGIILIGIIMKVFGEAKLLVWSARLLFIGIILFSGSLYALSISGLGPLGAITPLGGVCFIAGWICLATTAFKKE
ncbi:DUF423 domain-containing protein [Paenibacillus gallinarum]|uniref:DUF423 domain-containing protein n=1 Tax=Paenibacillus gallinarum TaxID=2762232 RepID=A0ABR8STV3_9BACL|nr:DUF423 domain-containing protein [Paenibacillus gallinarum]MBD7966932.1 DUF423 domain-containing protein [Paenibacillus gallinarum]